jgi:hypothetical protein
MCLRTNNLASNRILMMNSRSMHIRFSFFHAEFQFKDLISFVLTFGIRSPNVDRAEGLPDTKSNNHHSIVTDYFHSVDNRLVPLLHRF